MSFQLYDVDGVDRPLRLSADHAEQIGATLHKQAEDAGDPPADDDLTVVTDDQVTDDPKPGTKAALVAEAERLGLPTDGTKADLEARIAEAP